jgi:hypothetical protein
MGFQRGLAEHYQGNYRQTFGYQNHDVLTGRIKCSPKVTKTLHSDQAYAQHAKPLIELNFFSRNSLKPIPK